MSITTNNDFLQETVEYSQLEEAEKIYSPEKQSLLSVEIKLSAIKNNFNFLKRRTSAELMPVVKADAYGHGTAACARALLEEGARLFAVGTVEEGVILRRAGVFCPVIAMLSITSAEDVQRAIDYDIIPFVCTFAQLEAIKARALSRPFQLALKFDTGMGRLGFSSEQTSQVTSFLKESVNLSPFMVATHLAVADESSGEEYTLSQLNKFQNIVESLRSVFPDIKASALNSAGILEYSARSFDIARPGIALYGANTLPGSSPNSKAVTAALQQAMSVKAPILETRRLLKGESVNYGRTFIAPHNMNVAIIAAGYAEGYSRRLSNKGIVQINGQRAKVLGRVCMQLIAADISHDSTVKEGDCAYLLGGKGDSYISATELAQIWETIPYEVFCLLGVLNKREYII